MLHFWTNVSDRMCYPINCLALLYLIPIIYCVQWKEYKGLWYYISKDEKVDYAQATHICESMNSHLAVITNNDQNGFLMREEPDTRERWIGMSTRRTDHNPLQCNKTSMVWVRDWNCTVDFTPTIGIVYTTSTKCSGVTAQSSIWAVQSCSKNFGFICQWDCKRFYLNIRYDSGRFNGVFEFYDYYNGHARYQKHGTDRKIKIYRSKSFEWIIDNENEVPTQRAKSANKSFVPYGPELSWTTSYNAPLISGTQCIECSMLHMCISLMSRETSKCFDIVWNGITLEYANTENNVFLRYHQKSESCICMPTRMECGQRCGYIFPYPNVTTRITFQNDENVNFTNLCFPQGQGTTTTEPNDDKASITEQYDDSTVINKLITTMATDGNNKRGEKISPSGIYQNTVTPDVDGEPNSSHLTAIVASVVSMVIIIIIIVVIVALIIVFRMRKNIGHRKPQFAKALNNNEYHEYDEPTPVNRLEPAYTESAIDGFLHDESATDGQYTYIDGTDLHIKPKSTKTCDENIPTSTNDKEKPKDGYLAPDYGTLMDEQSRQHTEHPKQMTQQPVYTEVKEAHGKRQDIQQDEVCGNDRQIFDNQDSNCETKDDGDDDLELFENTVYNQM